MSLLRQSACGSHHSVRALNGHIMISRLLNDSSMPDGERRRQPPGHGHKHHGRKETAIPLQEGLFTPANMVHVQLSHCSSDKTKSHINGDESSTTTRNRSTKPIFWVQNYPEPAQMI